MGIVLSNENIMDALNGIQKTLTVTNEIMTGSYMCDCTGCSNGCFEFCSDGHGPTD